MPQNLCRAERTVRLGEIGAIAPVLAGTEEEDLNAGHAAFLMDGKGVSLFNRLRIDALMGLHMRKRRQTIPVNGCMLKIKVRRRGLHCRCEVVLYRLALAGKKRLGLIDEFGIVLIADLVRAGAGTTLDLKRRQGRVRVSKPNPCRSAAGRRAEAR